jgi:glycosyltransferase involved in cell wall biosynthesis
MKQIAMLLNGPIKNDNRVIKIIQTLSSKNSVHLFYIDGENEDKNIFNNNVSLYNFPHNVSIKIKILRHTWFCYEFNHFINDIKILNKKFDFIWANDLPLLYPAYKISEFYGASLIYDSHEIYTETINQFFPIRSSVLKKIIYNWSIAFMRFHGKQIEKKTFPFIDTFITVNNSLLDYFSERYTINKGVVVMNFPRIEENQESKVFDYRLFYSWSSDSIILLYQGQLNEGRGLTYLFETIKLLPIKYKLVLIGNGSIESDLKKWVNAENLNNRIKFIDTVSTTILSSYTKGANLGINLLESLNLSKQLASPNKLFEYIQAEIPVLATNTIENKRVFDSYKIGMLTENNPMLIAESIEKIMVKTKQEYKIELKNAKLKYSWGNQIELLTSIIEKN